MMIFKQEDASSENMTNNLEHIYSVFLGYDDDS